VTCARSPHNRHVSIELPLPPAALSPNARVDRRRVAPIRAAYREHACAAGIAAQDRGPRRRWDFTTVTYQFHLPDRRRRDIDNLIASAKAILDGLQDAQVFTDDAGVRLVAERYLDPHRPRLQVEVRPRHPMPHEIGKEACP